MNILLLTSSRADYSIYLPLLKLIKVDGGFNLKITAFGSHLSDKFGNTVEDIFADGFSVAYKVENPIETNSPASITQSMGVTTQNFTPVFEAEAENNPLIFCLGDRFEMLAAVLAAVPFNLQIAHIHGGETTYGAIDNVFRNALTAISKYHFTSTKAHTERVVQITGSNENIYTVGALALDNLNTLELLDVKSFNDKYQIDLEKPTILTTFHPETIAYEKNEEYANTLVSALSKVGYQVVITMPNADTMNDTIRHIFSTYAEDNDSVHIFESFGTLGYYSCMKHCTFLLGNSSSGIVEAASLNKYTIDLGMRQSGRDHSDNVIHCDIDETAIINAIKDVEAREPFSSKNIYGDGKSADRILKVLKEIKY